MNTIRVSKKLPSQLRGTSNISYESKIIKRNETEKRVCKVFSKFDRLIAITLTLTNEIV